MKTLTRLLAMLLLAASLFQCSKDEEVVPQSQNPINSRSADTLSIKNENSKIDDFSVVGEKTGETDTSYSVTGALFVGTDSGKVAVAEASTFTVTNDLNGDLKSIKGTGPVKLPDFGIFKSFNFQKAFDAAFEYNTGKFFKDNNDDFKKLPLRDTSYYFFFNLLNLAPGQQENMNVKNAKIGITSYFINISQQEIIIPTGSFGFDFPGGGSFNVGEDLAIGISAKKAFQFTPQQFADSALNAVIKEKQAFSDMTGFLYLSGEISLGDEIPMKLGGNSVLDGNMDEIFSKGFKSSSFSYAINGKVIFGNDLLDLLPVNFETELANATYKLDHNFDGTTEHASFKFAGQFDDNAWMETVVDKISGTDVSKYIPFTGNEGTMYASFGNDWEFFVNTYFAINTPHLGKQKAREGTLHVTSEQLDISGSLSIPFMPGEIAASGTFGYDGSVHLRAKANGNIQLEQLKLKSNLDIDINNDGATLTGDVFFPYGLAKIDVDGVIDSEGLTFSGSADNRSVKFGKAETPLNTIEVDVNVRKTNPYLKINGKMEFPQMEQPLVEVSGGIDSRGLELSGMINSALKASDAVPRLPLINVSLLARSWEGVYFNGKVVIPYGIANATATGQLTGKTDAARLPEILLNLNFESDPSFGIGYVSLPTSNLEMFISTVDGIKFTGKVKAPHFTQYMDCSGEINGKDISIHASIENGLLTMGGGLLLNPNLTVDFGNHLFPYIAKIVGDINSPFGKMNVHGTVGANGNIFLTSQSSGCANIPLVSYSTEYVNTFTFSSMSGVAVSVSANVCENDCDKKQNCNSVDAEIQLDWENAKLKLCVPVPVIGKRCVSL